jgi:S-formylglutathione hydrolase FrmB
MLLGLQRVTRRAIAALALACGFAFASPARAQQPRTGRLVYDTLNSAALAHNKFGDRTAREVLVYLPPSYTASTTTRYAVVYLLHGYGGTDRTWLGSLNGFSIRTAMDSVINAGSAREMIVVMPNGGNRLGGSFYTNSAATGNWDDFIAKELVAYVDGKYRTLARPASRGLVGHSMGGFGAFYLGMQHGGDVYGAVYALSGCCTRVLGAMSPTQAAGWSRALSAKALGDFRGLGFFAQVDLALSAAFSPDTVNAPFFSDLPVHESDGSLSPVASVARLWEQHLPFNMLQLDPKYAGNLKRLRGFAFDGGDTDPLVPPAQLQLMDSAFTQLGVPHTYEMYAGDHVNQIGRRMVTKVLPFFSRTLDFTTARRGSVRHTFR